MWEFEIYNIITKEIRYIIGRAGCVYPEVLKEYGYNPLEWSCIRSDYLD